MVIINSSCICAKMLATIQAATLDVSLCSGKIGGCNKAQSSAHANIDRLGIVACIHDSKEP